MNHRLLAKEEREEGVKLVMNYLFPYTRMRTNTNDISDTELRDLLKKEMGEFFFRGYSDKHTFMGFWGEGYENDDFTNLNMFARALAKSAHSEATVERHFKRLSSVISKHRAVLSAERADNCMFLAINHKELHPEHFPVFHASRDRRAQRRAALLSQTSHSSQPASHSQEGVAPPESDPDPLDVFD